jgi:hypothetical protein
MSTCVRMCLVGLLVACLSSVSFGFVVTWTNAGGDQKWDNPANWDMSELLAQVPPITNTLPNQNANWVVMATSFGPKIMAGMAAEATSIRCGNPAGVTMRMTGGTLTMNDWFMTGTDAPDGIGTFIMSGGTITTTAPFWVGFVGEGHVTMSGGIINASDFTMNVTGQVGDKAALSTMVMSGTAKMILNGDITAKLQGYVDKGMLSGARWDYNVTNAGKTTVQVIPEPATLALLAIGGIAALRRRK